MVPSKPKIFAKVRPVGWKEKAGEKERVNVFWENLGRNLYNRKRTGKGAKVNKKARRLSGGWVELVKKNPLLTKSNRKERKCEGSSRFS